MLFSGYDTSVWFDEIFENGSLPRPEAELLVRMIESLPRGEFGRLQESANAAPVNLGITFNVYSDGAGEERVPPFDIVPRIVKAAEWEKIGRGRLPRLLSPEPTAARRRRSLRQRSRSSPSPPSRRFNPGW